MLTTLSHLWPGVLLSCLIAAAAQLIALHYGAPAMLMALLFGIALNFLSDEENCKEGIQFASRGILRFGVALLGMQISLNLATDLGWPTLLMIIVGVAGTIGFGLLSARFLDISPRFAFLSGGSVAICGASAAMAIGAILPKDERSDERIVFTVVSVTVLSTIAMILYPILAQTIGFTDRQAGVFLGATIHDVAQVVGAGFSISPEAGEVATLVKLIRVALLAPVILVASLVLRRTAVGTSGERPPILPGFVIGFIALFAANAAGIIPTAVQSVSADLSRAALVTAISAVGLKTSLKKILEVGPAAISVVVLETLFLAMLVLIALIFIL